MESGRESPAYYMVDAVCEFADPRGRERLPLAQTYRRYARGYGLVLSCEGDGSFEEAIAWSVTETQKDGFTLWRDHVEAVGLACLSAIHHVAVGAASRTLFSNRP
jgi:hypothetical protein